MKADRKHHYLVITGAFFHYLSTEIPTLEKRLHLLILALFRNKTMKVGKSKTKQRKKKHLTFSKMRGKKLYCLL